MNTTRHHHKNRMASLLLFLITLVWISASADTTWESNSQPTGLTVRLSSLQSPLPLNQMHQWEIQISDSQGEPVDVAEVTVTGGMPEHDHGLATSPRVTQQLGDGKYLLEGMRFHMPGLWKLDFTIIVDNQRYLVEQSFTL